MSDEGLDAMITRLLAQPQDPNVRYPLWDYCADGDMLEITLEPEAYWVPWPPSTDGVVYHMSQEDNRVVGLTIHGFKQRLARKA